MNREVISLRYIKVSEAAQKWGISPRRVRVLCAENRIGGVIQKGKLYMIPADAEKPDDARATKSTKTALMWSCLAPARLREQKIFCMPN